MGHGKKDGTTMNGKICMVTGSNSGIGKATATGLAKMGASVVMVCRDRERGETAQVDIKTQSGNQAVDLLIADLSSQASIRQLADEFKTKYQQLHVLVNNAGVYRTKRYVTQEGIELHFAVNYLAPFLLTNLLLDTLKASAPARVVNVAGMYHRKASMNFDDLMSEKDYNPGDAQNQTKLALVLFTYELARRLEGTGVTANCLHPGAVATNLTEKDPDMPPITLFFQKLFKPFFMSPEKGAATSLYLASSPEVEGVTGKYFEKKAPSERRTHSPHRVGTGRTGLIGTGLVRTGIKTCPFLMVCPARVFQWQNSPAVLAREI
jgi:NAD(P)-dependent dehydrogenase (short-subunit alcohol dehydrogenase family)